MRVNRDRRALSEINVTPLVDVMLVLLVIFMVTAPLMQQGLDIDLPKAKGKELPPDERLTVVINKDGSLFLNDETVTLKGLHKTLSGMKDPQVYLRADKDVPYGMVVRVMSAVKEAGVEKLGMITEPDEDTR